MLHIRGASRVVVLDLSATNLRHLNRGFPGDRRSTCSSKSMRDLEKFAENVSIIDGPPVRVIGIPLSTRMIVVKLATGLLWVNSPVSVPLEVLDRIAASGPVRYLVAPTKLHSGDWKSGMRCFPAQSCGGLLRYRISSSACRSPAFWATRRLMAGRMTSTNSSSKATFLSRKSFSFIKSHAR